MFSLDTNAIKVNLIIADNRILSILGLLVNHPATAYQSYELAMLERARFPKVRQQDVLNPTENDRHKHLPLLEEILVPSHRAISAWRRSKSIMLLTLVLSKTMIGEQTLLSNLFPKHVELHAPVMYRSGLYNKHLLFP